MLSELKYSIKNKLEQSWYSKSGITLFLRPLSWLFIVLSKVRRLAYKLGIKKTSSVSVPVIVVGNLTVGGTGKTPLVIWLANFLKEAGYKPGVISRGYGGRARSWPQQVRPDADPVMVGDEAVVIARRTGCPMAVGPDRVAVANALLKYFDCDVIISDDGLQHYALERDIEVLVIDGVRRFGNGFCLPAGPLRETIDRQNEVDCKVTNGIAALGEYAMKYVEGYAINLCTQESRPLTDFSEERLYAIAGIGNPDRFFNYLRSKGLRITSRSFPDHFMYEAENIGDFDGAVLMTEKDAVKCCRFAKPDWWYVHADVQLSEEFGLQMINLIEKRHG